MSEPLHIISLGAGVQSSTMALMAAKGEIAPMPTCAIFADTKCEPLEVYRWLDWLEKQLPFPVHRVAEKRGLLSNIVRLCDHLDRGDSPLSRSSPNPRAGAESFAGNARKNLRSFR